MQATQRFTETHLPALNIDKELQVSHEPTARGCRGLGIQNILVVISEDMNGLLSLDINSYYYETSSDVRHPSQIGERHYRP